MNFEDEKDYIMRIIKEAARILFSLLFGRQYVSVEQELRDKYQVSGKNLDDLFGMIDAGDINEAEMMSPLPRFSTNMQAKKKKTS